jgi:tripartite motif-containing protein 71
MDSLLPDDNDKRNDISTNLFLTNFLNTLPKIDALQNRAVQIDNSKNGNTNIFSNILPFEMESNKPFSYKHDSPLDLYGSAPGSNVLPKQKSTSRSNSPHSSSSSSQSIYCGRCENNACHRCLDCNDVFCSDCVSEHMINSFTEKHNIITIGKITPIGIGAPPPAQSLFFGDLHLHSINEPQCENHNEQLRFLCNTCKKVICQECSLKEHKDHEYMSVANITVDKAKDKLKAICESSKLGIKFIKTSIDRAVAASQSVERDALEISSRVRKALRLLILGMYAK